MKIKVSKIDAAKEQIETSIILFFNDKSPISVHTLVSASLTLLDESLKKNGGSKFTQSLEDKVKSENLKDFRYKLNAAANFFKHANKPDPEAHDFNTALSEIKLFQCCVLFREHFGYRTKVMEGYMMWMIAMHPILYSSYTEKRGSPGFPLGVLDNLSRSERLEFGKKLIEEKDKE